MTMMMMIITSVTVTVTVKHTARLSHYGRPKSKSLAWIHTAAGDPVYDYMPGLTSDHEHAP